MRRIMYAITVWRTYDIATMSQFTDCNEAQLKKIISEVPELSEIINALSQKH